MNYVHRIEKGNHILKGNICLLKTSRYLQMLFAAVAHLDVTHIEVG
jgi:hypothetical protein